MALVRFSCTILVVASSESIKILSNYLMFNGFENINVNFLFEFSHVFDKYLLSTLKILYVI